MPQIKPPLRFYSESHYVHWKVRQQLEEKKKSVPQNFDSLIAIACFPDIVKLDGWCYSKSAFEACYARDPDLALEILTMARTCLKQLDDQSSQSARVRKHLLNNPSKPVVMNDCQIAAELSDKRGFEVRTDSVATERKALSLQVKTKIFSKRELAALRRQIRTEIQEAGLPMELEETYFKAAQRVVLDAPKGPQKKDKGK